MAPKNTAPPRGQIRAGEHSNHATVLVMGEKDWTPFQRAEHVEHDKARIYLNSRYQVAVYPAETPAKGWPKVVHLSFKHVLNIAITDFRDMQLIKNDLVGPKSYCIQVFPPESMLVDTSNQYHLWAFVPASWEPGENDKLWSVAPKDEDAWPFMPVGFFDGRVLSEAPLSGGRQRTFDDEHLPGDLKEQEAKVHELLAERTQLMKQGSTAAQAREVIESKSSRKFRRKSKRKK